MEHPLITKLVKDLQGKYPGASPKKIAHLFARSSASERLRTDLPKVIAHFEVNEGEQAYRLLYALAFYYVEGEGERLVCFGGSIASATTSSFYDTMHIVAYDLLWILNEYSKAKYGRQ